MRLTRIRCESFLSFDADGIDLELDRDLTVIVGPNGAGKTNVVRAIDLVRAAITKVGNPTSIYPSPTPNPEDTTLADYAQSGRHQGSPGRPLVAVGIKLTTERERSMVTAFFRAAVVSSFITAIGLDEQGAWLAGGWADQEITPTLLTDLFSGTITVYGPPHPAGSWSVVYGFRSGDVEYGWVLSAGSELNRVRRLSDSGTTKQSPTVDRLDARSLGGRAEMRPLPRSLSELADLLPPDGEFLSLTVENLFSHLNTVSPFRQLTSLLDIGPTSSQASQMLGLGRVLWAILAEGTVRTTNARLPPQHVYSLDETPQHPDLADGSHAPLALYRLKNGQAAQRATFSRVQEIFSRVAGPHLRLDLVADTTRSPATDDQSLRLRASVVGHDREVPIEFAGQGLWEACVLATLVADSRDQSVILDEPAAGLHPTLQRKLPTLLASAAGQVLVITHSPYLVPSHSVDDLRSIIRITSESGASRAHVFDSTTVEDHSALATVDKLHRSTELRSLLFANGVILVEGGTEFGLLPIWMEQSARRGGVPSPDDDNIAFFDVGGDESFVNAIKFLHRFHIPWLAFADGKVFDPARLKHILKQVAGALEPAMPPDLAHAMTMLEGQPDFATVKQAGERLGVFTLASTWETPGEGIETYLRQVDAAAWDAACREEGRSKPRRGRHFAWSVPCPTELDSIFAAMLGHLRTAAHHLATRWTSP